MASMYDPTSERLVEPIRFASRRLVRELGFMSETLAETNYPPSAVHGLIEIGDGRATTATQLCRTLNVKDTCVRNTTRALVDGGDVEEVRSVDDDGENFLSLTAKGHQSLTEINTFARDQVLGALSHNHNRDAEYILLGLQTYVASLEAQRIFKAVSSPGVQVEIVRGYQPGLIGRAVEMHSAFYSKTAGFGAYFESQVASGLADLVLRINSDRNEAWTAKLRDKIVGTIFLDGEDLGENKAHVRAFIVDDEIRGGGVGRQLLKEMIDFVDSKQFDETRLWTFQGLDAARRLYESFGFVLQEQYIGSQWGKEMTEQMFVRKIRVR